MLFRESAIGPSQQITRSSFLEESIARLALQSLMVRAELAGRLRPN
jgi:hypothetical protein